MGHASRLLWLKKHCLRTLPTLEQSRHHGGDFSHTPCSIWGKSRRGRPMASYGRLLGASSDALSGKQRLRASDQPGGQRAKWRQDPSPCGQGIPLGVTVTGANVHDSRLIGATLKNSREMGGCFLGAEFDTSVWTRGMVIHESAWKSMLTDLTSISEAGGKKSVKAGGLQPAAGSGTDICQAEGFSEPAHLLLLLPHQFYGTALPCLGLHPLEKTGIARCLPDILLCVFRGLHQSKNVLCCLHRRKRFSLDGAVKLKKLCYGLFTSNEERPYGGASKT